MSVLLVVISMVSSPLDCYQTNLSDRSCTDVTKQCTLCPDRTYGPVTGLKACEWVRYSFCGKQLIGVLLCFVECLYLAHQTYAAVNLVLCDVRSAQQTQRQRGAKVQQN